MKRTLAAASGLTFFLFLLTGCKLSPPPDPNDPRDVGLVQAEVLMRNLQWASRAVNERVSRGEISDEEGKKILAEEAGKLLDAVSIKRVRAKDAWRYAEVFRTAQRWERAEELFETASKHATDTKNEDRRVNDTLRLAEAQAQLGKTVEALATARSVFNAKPENKAPILLAVLYEIVPAAKGKGKDLELARLLEDAIAQHEQVIVDPESDGGKAFFIAKGHHIEKAYSDAVDLYEAAHEPDLAEAARKRHAVWQRGRVRA
jgi:tetratricopeptide (TPR) repeat protein